MASLWQKTLFYLGLVDEDDTEPVVEPPQDNAGVRTVEPPRTRSARPSMAGAAVEPPGEAARQGGIAGRRIEPPATQRRRVSDNRQHAEAGVYVHDAPAYGGRSRASSALCEIIEASTFTDAQVLADHIRNDRPVVLDLRTTEPAMVRRLVDFATGLTYALDGRMAKTAQGVILVTPQGQSLDVDEQQRLADLGLYQLDR
jgi:FtsZ-interacting cell division protein YlmF